MEHGSSKCDAPTIQKIDLQNAVVKAINIALGNRDSIIKALQKNIETVLKQTDKTSVENIDAKLEPLKRVNAKKDYNDIAYEIYNLRKLKHKALAEDAEKKGSKQRIEDMTAFLNGQSTSLEEYNEQLIRRLIGKITVYEERFTVEFKSGIEVDVEM